MGGEVREEAGGSGVVWGRGGGGGCMELCVREEEKRVDMRDFAGSLFHHENFRVCAVYRLRLPCRCAFHHP